MTCRSKMPTKKAILEYWDPVFGAATDFYGWDIGWSDVFWNGDCMACGSWLKTQRAHIVAVVEGGSNEAENLHVLCSTCHEESELKSGQEYWDWFGYRLNSDSYMTIRIKALSGTDRICESGAIT